MASRECQSCGLTGRWHSTVCGPCRKLVRAAPPPGRAEAFAARWAATADERWVKGPDGLYYPKTETSHRDVQALGY